MAVDVDELVRLANLLEAARIEENAIRLQINQAETALAQLEKRESAIRERVRKARDALLQRVGG